MNSKLMQISRVITFALRHRPESIGIRLNKAGWVKVSALLEGLASQGHVITMDELKDIVILNDKQRFALSPDELEIRANQGHSVKVDLGLKTAVPPVVLYHGTHVGALASILKSGIQKQSRHDVHLSATKESAVQVGKRHGKPVILVINCKKMYADGHQFRISVNGVWLTEHVPAKYISKQM